MGSVESLKQTATSCHSSSSIILDVSDLATSMRASTRNYVKQQQQRQDPIRMVGVLAEYPGRPSDAESYSQAIARTFAEDGLHFDLVRCSGDQPEQVESTIQELNQQDDIHGILVFYPIFRQRTAAGLQDRIYQSTRTGVQYTRPAPTHYLDEQTGVHYKTVDDYLRDCVSFSKDVEGLCHDYTKRWQKFMFRRRGNRLPNDIYLPCTASAVLKILSQYHPRNPDVDYPFSGCTATIINRSTILGRPLAALLALQGATVFSVDEHSILSFQSGGRMRQSNRTLPECLMQSDIIVTAVPDETFQIDADLIPDQATLIDVSYHDNIDPDVLNKGNIRLVQNIGQVTVATLEHSLIRLHSHGQVDLSPL